jgi:hypothetical protein
MVQEGERECQQRAVRCATPDDNGNGGRQNEQRVRETVVDVECAQKYLERSRVRYKGYKAAHGNAMEVIASKQLRVHCAAGAHESHGPLLTACPPR